MDIKHSSTLTELLQAGFTITTPSGFEMRGDLKGGSIAMRSPTPVGMTAAGHAPLSDMGCYVVAQNADAYEKMVALEEAISSSTS